MSQEIFVLDIRFPDRPPKRIEIQNKLAFGSDKRCKIHYQDYDLAPIHCLFVIKDGVLTLQNNGGERPTILNGNILEHQKKYVIDQGDKIELGDIDIIIRAQEQEELPDNTLVRKLFPGDLQDNESEDDQEELSFEVSLPETPSSKDQESENNDEKVIEDNGVVEEEQISKEELSEELTPPKESIETTKKEEPTEEVEVPSEDQANGYDEILSQEEELINEEDNDKAELKEEKQKKVIATKKVPENGELAKDRKVEAKVDIPQNAKSNSKQKLDVVGLLPRLFSFIAQISLISIFLQYSPWKIPDNLMAQITEKVLQGWQSLSPALSFIPENLLLKFQETILTPKVIGLTIYYLGLEIIQNIIFGISLPLLLFGATTRGGFLLKRLTSIFRIILLPITIPFLFLDLPIVFKKSSIRELLTYSTIHFRTRYLKLLGLVPCLILMLLPIEIPLIKNEVHKVQPILTQTLNIKKDKLETYSLELLGIETKADLGSMIIYPRIGSSAKSPVGIDFYRYSNLERAGIKLLETKDSLHLIRKYKTNNFFFKICNPILDDSLENSTALLGSDDELMGLIEMSFNIHLESLPQILISQGIAIHKLYELKDNVLKALDLESKNPEVSIIKAKEKNFLQFFDKEDSIYTLVTIHNLKLYIYSIDYSKRKNFGENLIRKVFAHAHFPDSLKQAKRPHKAFELSNILNQVKFDSKAPEAEELAKMKSFYHRKFDEASHHKEPKKALKLLKRHTKELINLITNLAKPGPWQDLSEFNDIIKLNKIILEHELE